MNDKQESAINMSERDIENAFIQQDNAAVYRELAESNDSEYDKGMRHAMQKIAQLCGRNFAVNVGYVDLPDVVEAALTRPESGEWKYNDDVIFDIDCTGVFIGLVPDDNDKAIIYQPDFNRTLIVKVRDLSAPLTLAQVAAIDLYSSHCLSLRHPVKDLLNDHELMTAWLAIVNKTGYRHD